MLYPKISEKIEEKNQTEIIKEYKENISKSDEEKINKEYEKAKIYNENLKGENKENDKYEEILNLSGNGIMSYIEIPKVSIYLPIYHGTENEVLKKGAGHIKNTSLPIGGIDTHTVLTGHTGLIKAKIFTKINELEIGDIINIYTLEKRLTYKVYNKKIVLPEETKDLQIEEDKDLLTLVTCTPYGINTHRLLVQSVRTQNEDKKIKLDENIEDYRKEEDKNYTIIILVVIFCCILLNKIVKYLRKER